MLLLILGLLRMTPRAHLCMSGYTFRVLVGWFRWIVGQTCGRTDEQADRQTFERMVSVVMSAGVVVVTVTVATYVLFMQHCDFLVPAMLLMFLSGCFKRLACCCIKEQWFQDLKCLTNSI